MRSPIRRVVEQRVARGVPSVPRHTTALLAAAPHGADALSVVASLLRAAHRGGPALPRVLSCRATLRAVLSACAAAPAASPQCRALCSALCLRALFRSAAACGDAPHALRCAAAVAPTAAAGERLALRSIAAGGTAAAAAAALAQRCERHSSAFPSSPYSYSPYSSSFISSSSPSSSYAEWAAAFLRVWRLSPLRSTGGTGGTGGSGGSGGPGALLLLSLSPPPGADAVRCAEFEIAQCAAAGLRDETAALVAAQSTAALSAMRDATLASAYALIGGSGDALPLREALIAASRASLSVSVSSVASPFARGRSLPAVARDGALLAAVLRGVVRDAQCETKTKSAIAAITPQQQRALRDIEALCAMANAYGIAASFVPHDSSGDNNENNCNNKENKELVLAAAMAKKWDATRARRLAAVVAAVGEAAEFAAAAGDAAALQRAVGVLSELFALCSEKTPKNSKHSKHSKNSKHSEHSEGRPLPAWRERLRGAEARTHKYELLCAEVPHAHVAQCLAAVLSHGFVAAAAELGARLAAGGLVDLRHYPLSLLGALFHAARAAQQPPGAAEAIAALYVRRRRVFGEDEPKGSETALVLRGDGPRVEALRARSTAAAGGAFVVDQSFGVWLRKATASAAAC